MKLSIFKKMIRDIIREELDYKFNRLRKELKEVVVSSNNVDLNKARTHTTQDTSLKSMMNGSTGTDSNITTTTKSVPSPKTNNNVLNSLLEETAQSDDWKTVEGKGEEVQSVQDNTSELPEHLANAFTKDYSDVMKKVDEKDRFKNGA